MNEILVWLHILGRGYIYLSFIVSLLIIHENDSFSSTFVKNLTISSSLTRVMELTRQTSQTSMANQTIQTSFTNQGLFQTHFRIMQLTAIRIVRLIFLIEIDIELAEELTFLFPPKRNIKSMYFYKGVSSYYLLFHILYLKKCMDFFCLSALHLCSPFGIS